MEKSLKVKRTQNMEGLKVSTEFRTKLGSNVDFSIQNGMQDPVLLNSERI